MNQGLVQSKSSLTEVEKFGLAITGNRIDQVEPIRIREVVGMILVKLGIREHNLPTGLEMEVLVNHIHDNYGRFTIEEVKLAFDLAIMNKLDCDANPYEVVSCRYVSVVMEAYRVWAERNRRKLIQSKKALELPVQVISDDEIVRVSRECYKKTRNPVMILIRCFEIMKVTIPPEDEPRLRALAANILSKITDVDRLMSWSIDPQENINNLVKKIAVSEILDKEFEFEKSEG